ncbi:acyl-CoA carboxylase subunit epsilon [Streptomyces sp. YIM S03343]
MTTPDIRVEKGQADPEEVAAITAVLLARAAAKSDSAGAEGHGRRPKARWRRLEREGGFRSPHSWRG